MQKIDPKAPSNELAMRVSRALGGVTILQKGKEDIIATNTSGASAEDARESKADPSDNTEEQLVIDVPGGLKRCGGQGDILSGTVGTVLAWGKCFEDGAFGYVRPADRDWTAAYTRGYLSDGSVPSSRIPLLAAAAGSMVTRTSSKHAFAKQGRGERLDLIPRFTR